MADQDTTKAANDSAAQNQEAANSNPLPPTDASASVSSQDTTASDATVAAASSTPVTSEGTLAHLKDEFREWFEDGEREAHEVIEWFEEKLHPKKAA